MFFEIHITFLSCQEKLTKIRDKTCHKYDFHEIDLSKVLYKKSYIEQMRFLKKKTDAFWVRYKTLKYSIFNIA